MHFWLILQIKWWVDESFGLRPSAQKAWTAHKLNCQKTLLLLLLRKCGQFEKMNFLQAEEALKKSESDSQIIESEFEKVKVNLRKPIEACVHPDPIPHYLRSSHIFYLGSGIPQNQFYVTHKWGLVRQYMVVVCIWAALWTTSELRKMELWSQDLSRFNHK